MEQRCRRTERRAATEQQLHETVTARAWAKAYEWEQYRARQAEAKAARAAAAAAQPADDVPAAPMAPVVLPAPRPLAAPDPVDGDDQKQELVLEDLTCEQVLAQAYTRHPERFGRRPQPPAIPQTAWINDPTWRYYAPGDHSRSPGA
ncbi:MULTISPECIES: hypothetical protein [Streptomyces]|uniref:hypothetical protein n=1 Tax=Streptomyces TaxID=1883 RepID=UPI000F473FEE|nr:MULTISPECIES: hypothetical protein [Streptomyces]MBO0913407.1 hypothetical protein [Streptomyces laculatispora]MCX4774472.1 hypothetical protein [Streptomyces sp. NBC_01285]ROQ73049.1 hypothetical protein EDD95_5695 [Streptomyces sp. CEV 2-1]